MLAVFLLAIGDPDSGGGSDLAVEAAGTVCEDEAEVVAVERFIVNAGLHRAVAAVEEEVVAVRAGRDELVGFECLESVAEAYFSVDDTFLAVGGGHAGMGECYVLLHLIWNLRSFKRLKVGVDEVSNNLNRCFTDFGAFSY